MSPAASENLLTRGDTGFHRVRPGFRQALNKIQLGGIDPLDHDCSGGNLRAKMDAEASSARQQRRGASSKVKNAQPSPRLAAVAAHCRAMLVLPQPAGPIKRVLVPRSRPPPVKASSSAMPSDATPTV